ncbi:TetR/AcrR family transcriptional regulator [Allokutzneria albata]|uniref:DNA-binding transcriptional regulator, AcrR family n=1 Tax=Allokutzneria albata TaxID=211114 RepID=A0A1G9YJ10_ALLAB|nr:TetR/AcrR family transcriptional regulator [Allokutzneria albata]SDN08473.1 DNA-binding transcriptional regulator, AcrR family [Allokutzneria albata]
MARGRPRSAQAQEAIIGATLAVLVETGFAGLTIEAVASRAGVGRPTIYRRWATREDLVVDALAATVPVTSTVDTGDLLADIASTVRTAIDGLGGSELGGAVIGVLAASAANPLLASALAERYLAPRLGVVSELIARGAAEGVLRSDLGPEVIRDLLIGPLVYHWLVTGAPMPESDSGALFTAVLSTLRA